MELREVIRQRRSVRRYTEKTVPREVLERLLEDACWAPSAENYQPWHFVALTKPEEIASIVVFLAGNQSDYMTGATLDATGGMLMR